eukprot:TRINITY_DN3375_c0_g1_i1.p1 TRINITY_DN3375_c0_g1~~TRINITY_DN3375_c0_g1_i1.p1  ORF type:complete len:1152 (+),score=185.49 TRINITY_DN3375_c0_g1_i1:103-3558(+)
MPRPVVKREPEDRTTCSKALCCICLNFAVIGIVVGMGLSLLPPEVSLEFSDFMKTDIPVSAQRDAYLAALGEQEGSRRLRGRQVYHVWEVELYYRVDKLPVAENSSDEAPDILNSGLITSIAEFEKKLREEPAWKRVCDDVSEKYSGFCRRGVSLSSYSFASLEVPEGDIVPSALKLDGGGRDGLPMTLALDLAHQDGVGGSIFPEDFDFSSPSSNVLRTMYRFMYPCCLSNESTKEQRRKEAEQMVLWEDLKATVIPMLQKQKTVGSESVGTARIFFGGTGFKGFETMSALTNDILLASASMLFVLLYMIGHTGSVLLGFVGLIIIASAIPFAYVIAAVITGNQVLSLASFLSLFLVVGIGSDVVFVYSDFWQASAEMPSCKTEKDRLIWTLKTAGKASLATTATTAASFFANLASILKSLRDFGFFMGMCVMLVWVLVSTAFLPLCLVDERLCGNCKYSCKRRSRRCMDGITSPQAAACWNRRPSLDKWLGLLHPLSFVITMVFFLVAIGAGIWGGMVGSTSSAVPTIFPEGHNQLELTDVSSRFARKETVLPLASIPREATAEVCKEYEPVSSLAGCNVHWCEVRGKQEADPDKCQCLREELPLDCGSRDMATVLQRFVHADPEAVMGSSPTVAFAEANSGVNLTKRNTFTRELAPLITQDWYSGAIHVTPMSQLEFELDRKSSSSSCGWVDICYCNVKPCMQPSSSWKTVPGPRLPSTRRLTASGSTQWEVSVENHAPVAVTFGLELAQQSTFLGKVDLDQSWNFLPSFDMRDPWTQRHVLKFCEDLPTDLRVSSKVCWIENFRDYALEKSDRFPVLDSSFDSLVADFISRTTFKGVMSKHYFWVRDGKVKACRMTFRIDLHWQQASVTKTQSFKENWDEYVDSWNAKASAAAEGAVHTSKLWVQAEAVRELIKSTASTMGIAVAFSFLGMLVVTCDLCLSWIVVITTCAVVSLLLCFMAAIMQWAIGPIEIVALIAFIGYSMTYSLHIAHRYSSHRGHEAEFFNDKADGSTVRLERTRFALRTIGMAALGSANTTIGCSLPLLFCTITIFVKLGTVVLVVTVLSIMAAFGPLPAVLMWIGPLKPGTALKSCCKCKGKDAESSAENDITIEDLTEANEPGPEPLSADMEEAQPESSNVSPTSYSRRV